MIISFFPNVIKSCVRKHRKDKVNELINTNNVFFVIFSIQPEYIMYMNILYNVDLELSARLSYLLNLPIVCELSTHSHFSKFK